MAKKSFKLEDVEFALTKNQIESDKAKSLIEDLQAMLDEEAAIAEPKNPKEYMILVSDPDGVITTDLVGWPVQILEGEDPKSVVERISKATAEYHNTKKGKKEKCENLGQAIEFATRKFFTENEVWPKTKEPVLLVTTNNELMDLSNAE